MFKWKVCSTRAAVSNFHCLSTGFIQIVDWTVQNAAGERGLSAECVGTIYAEPRPFKEWSGEIMNRWI